MVSVTAKARTFGLSTEYVNLRGSTILSLQQRIAVIAQGRSDAVYGTTKFPALSSSNVGNKVGYGCPAFSIADMLLPANGDGVGTIPVTIYPLLDDPSATPSVGDITPAGTATKAQQWQVSVNGILSTPFVIPAGAVNVSDVCGKIGDAILGVLKMPVKPSYTYGSPTSAFAGVGNGTLTLLAIHAGSSPRPGVYTLKLKTVVANGGVFTMRGPDGSIVKDNITMTPGVGGVTAISDAAGLDFTLTDGTTDFGLTATFTITVPATKVVTTSVWKGESANAIKLAMVGDSSLGVTWGITQHSGGLVNPSVAPALAQFGTVWETLVMNAMGANDTAAMDALAEFNEGRWNELVRKPFVAVTGQTASVVTDAYALPATRKTDRTNAFLVAPGSPNLPYMVAARELARIAVEANENPPTDYGALEATGLTPGADGEQWDQTLKELALQNGCSSVDVIDSTIQIADVVTFYHPTGEEDPPYRYLVDIVKLQNCIYNIGDPFTKREWAGAPLVPDSQVVTNPKARSPKHVIACVAGTVTALGKAAIIANPDQAIASIKANITGPKRIDFEVTVQLSGNTNVKSAKLKFGFNYGG